MPQAQPDTSPVTDHRHRATNGHPSTDRDSLATTPHADTPHADTPHADMAALLAETEGLRQRLASQPVIEQAKGILMGHYGIDHDTAFHLLRRWSQNSNTKLRHIAELLTESAADGAGIRAAPHQIVQQAVPSPQRGGHLQPTDHD